MYANGSEWPKWMKDFRFGTLCFVPTGDLRIQVDDLRRQYDPDSAHTSMAHVTLTQPFSKAPTEDEISLIADVIIKIQRFNIQVGPVITSPNKRLLCLAVTPQDNVLNIRESLHDIGIFRTDLPLTKGFIPHMTISEKGRDPEEVVSINNLLNTQLRPNDVPFMSVTWIIPDEDFVFHKYRDFDLK